MAPVDTRWHNKSYAEGGMDMPHRTRIELDAAITDVWHHSARLSHARANPARVGTYGLEIETRELLRALDRLWGLQSRIILLYGHLSK